MDHTSQLPAPQPWRSAALIAATVAAVELALLLVLGVFLFGKLFAGEVEKATDPVTVARAADARDGQGSGPAPSEAEPTLLERGKTSVLVLNGNGLAGAAAAAAERVRARSYVVAGTGNAPHTDFARSVVIYRPGFRGEARRLGHDVGIRHVAPLDGMRARDLQGAHLALVVGG